MPNDMTLTRLNHTALVLKPIKSKSEIKDSEDVNGYLIDSDEKEIRRIAASLKNKNQKKIIAVLGRDDAFNRRILETIDIDYLVSPESGNRKDTLKQRDSGLNQVLGKIAHDKKIAIIIDFSSLNRLKDKDRALRLGRIIQNVKVCRRAVCKIKIATFASYKSELRTEREIKSFGFSLGMSSQQVKDCCDF